MANKRKAPNKKPPVRRKGPKVDENQTSILNFFSKNGVTEPLRPRRNPTSTDDVQIIGEVSAGTAAAAKAVPSKPAVSNKPAQSTSGQASGVTSKAVNPQNGVPGTPLRTSTRVGVSRPNIEHSPGMPMFANSDTEDCVSTPVTKLRLTERNLETVAGTSSSPPPSSQESSIWSSGPQIDSTFSLAPDWQGEGGGNVTNQRNKAVSSKTQRSAKKQEKKSSPAKKKKSQVRKPLAKKPSGKKTDVLSSKTKLKEKIVGQPATSNNSAAATSARIDQPSTSTHNVENLAESSGTESAKDIVVSLKVPDMFSPTKVRLDHAKRKLEIHLSPQKKSPGAVTRTGSCSLDCEAPSSSTNQRNRKKPPNYKRIHGTSYVVDAFNYGEIEGITAYFLSHFHSDHYQGLRKTFNMPVYCSQVTANLARSKLCLPSRIVHVLPMNQSFRMPDGVEVTLFDANHCPGSVMFWFHLPSGLNILHTGDVRADDLVLNSVAHIPVDYLYLDTTYMNPRYCFPPQDQVISDLIAKLDSLDVADGKTLVVCGSYCIGKERIFMAIAEHFDWFIGVSRDKWCVLECLEMPALTKRLRSDFTTTSLHVCSMQTVRSVKNLTAYLQKFPRFERLIGISPSGWEFKGSADVNVQRCAGGSILKISVPYSEHSSYVELERFVKRIRANKVIPTVYSGKEVPKMFQTLSKWRTE